MRWTPAENLHATLVFLGNISADDVDDLTAALRGVTDDAPGLALEVVDVRPAPDRRPRMVWADLAPNQALQHLSARLHDAGAPLAPSIRPPLRGAGHVTLARFRVRRPDLELAPLDLAHPRFDLGHVSLVQSMLGRGGAVYRTLAELPLSG